MRHVLMSVILLWGLSSSLVAAAPEQVHVSTLNDSIAVTWARLGDQRSAARDAVEVWPAGGGGSPVTVSPTTVRWVAPDTTIFSARIPWPDAASDLTYRVGHAGGGWTENATVPLGPSQGNGTWRLLAFGDHGVGESSNASALLPGRAVADRPNAILHLGDLSYANAKPPIWDQWFRLIEPMARVAFYMAAPGNHEHEGFYPATGPYTGPMPPGSGLHPYEQFVERFVFPPSELHYSFDVGPVHVLVMNTESMCVQADAQFHVPWRVNPTCQANEVNRTLLDWVERDLAAHAKAPWTFVMFHRPVFSAGAYQPGEPTLQTFFAPVFEKHGVDLVLSGHDHNYQRSFPMRGGRAQSTDSNWTAKNVAPVYVVSGGAGEGRYAFRCCGTGNQTLPDWTAARTSLYHYLRLDVREHGLRGQAVSHVSGEIYDEFMIGDFGENPVPSPSTSLPASRLPGLGAAWFLLGVAVVLWGRTGRRGPATSGP